MGRDFLPPARRPIGLTPLVCLRIRPIHIHMRLPILFFSTLLLCAGVFYWSQFSITLSHGDSARHRKRHGFSTLQTESNHAAWSASVAAADAPIHTRLRSRHRSNKRRHRKSILNVSGPTPTLHQQSRIQSLARAAEEAKLAADAAAASAAANAGTAPGCNRARRPYHVVMTAASGLYQEWQSRIAYYHYKKQKALHPCSDLGGFTRLFNNIRALPDALVDEMPTLLVSQLGHGACAECDRGFIVMNRPWGVMQLVESEHFRSKIEEEYILVIETDHMMMVPPVNTAQPDRPVGFGFYYMLGTDPKLKPVVQKFLEPGIDPSTVDAVGPSPIIIHKPLLAKVAKPWWQMSQRMQHDRDAQVIFGWVLEMWGYNCQCTSSLKARTARFLGSRLSKLLVLPAIACHLRCRISTPRSLPGLLYLFLAVAVRNMGIRHEVSKRHPG